jgi:hypothetical protein
MSLVTKIKKAMSVELEDNPDMTDREYEELFVKYYMYYMESHIKPKKIESKGKSYVR